ncbi:spindle pole body formation-associated protein-domain-containing protein [Coniella lustricola]|uniref:Spindle pole body formation-associated protein-domain-containing protein n=1 Tax=Coniella lustricola TaxID=2025994 RepID=A0A2T3ALA4_9PEZI|nr:spindle pole body formation-associated protein-domain-containing protein [Coniella lustricola]
MLGWAFNKATGGNASSNAQPGFGRDDTLDEQPDTPAPVFAARAFKRALFGTPGAADEEPPTKETKTAYGTDFGKPIFRSASSWLDNNEFDSPDKQPQGILLTPGAGTSRRKRVSFGRDVKANRGLLGGDTSSRIGVPAQQTRPRTRLQEALENSRKHRDGRNSMLDDHARKINFDPDALFGASDEEWEEVEELDRDPDITIDLNEPHSHSGRYWKGEFQKYHDEARVEMEKLVRYKQLAKSYAKAKDSEALELNERLRAEQAKVLDLEMKINEMSRQPGLRNIKSSNFQEQQRLTTDLNRQTSLVAQYKKRIEQLENLVKELSDAKDESTRTYTGTSARLAGKQPRELAAMRQELQRFKTELTKVEQRERQHELEKRELERNLSRKESQYDLLKAEYDALAEKNTALRSENLELRRGPNPFKAGNTGLYMSDNNALFDTGNTGQFEPARAGIPEYDPDFMSAGFDPEATSPWLKEIEDYVGDYVKKQDAEQESRRLELEDANAPFKRLRSGAKTTVPDSRWSILQDSNVDMRDRSTKPLELGEDAVDLLQYGRARTAKETDNLLGPSRFRSNNRAVAARTLDKEPTLTIDRPTPRSGAFGRPRTRTQLRQATSRALDLGWDDDLKSTYEAPRATSGGRAAISTDRKQAAMARVERKRAERKARDTPYGGKENKRL